jgi:hypothetical protein
MRLVGLAGAMEFDRAVRATLKHCTAETRKNLPPNCWGEAKMSLFFVDRAISKAVSLSLNRGNQAAAKNQSI